LFDRGIQSTLVDLEAAWHKNLRPTKSLSNSCKACIFLYLYGRL